MTSPETPDAQAPQPDPSNDYLYRLAETILAFEKKRAAAPDPGSPVQQEFVDVYKECSGQPAVEALAAFLSHRPQLQERLSFLVNYTPSKWLVEREIDVIKVLRQSRLQQTDNVTDCRNNPYAWMYGSGIRGICFSGGGIRSATFNLGILQGLSHLQWEGRSLLESFDYLSSVSGGGYIHQWLAAWIKREESLKKVQRQLIPLPESGCPPFHPAPLRWLRRYSNYLTPKTGFFSADIWVVAAIWLRNTFLNQLVLVSALLLLVLLPHVLAPAAAVIDLAAHRPAAQICPPLPGPAGGVVGCALQPKLSAGFAWLGDPRLYSVIGLLFFLVAVAVMAISLRAARLFGAAVCSEKRKAMSAGGSNGTAKWIVFLMLGSALCISRYVMMIGPWDEWSSAVDYSVFAAILIANIAIALAGGADQAFIAMSGYDSTKAGKWTKLWRWLQRYPGLIVIFSAIAAAAATGLFALTQGLLNIVVPRLVTHFDLEAVGLDPWKLALIVGPPLFLSVPFFSQVLLAGLIGRDFADWLREWLSRVRAWSLIIGTGWAAWIAVALLTRPLIDLTWNIQADKPIKWGALLTWAATTLGGVLAGKSPKTSGQPGSAKGLSSVLNVLAIVGPYVFVAGLLVLLAWAGDFILSTADTPLESSLVYVVPILVFALFGRRVDINEFSMNPFYRNRLTRCYLGATNLSRRPNPLTGFDECDTKDTVLSTFLPAEPEKAGGLNKPQYRGPFPIIGATLNLTFGEDLAWQERKAASFAFTPLYSGYHVGWTSGSKQDPLSYNGYVPTRTFAYPGGGINMATAVAISGAAVSPNWGYHTNPATAFLLTMFNVRLGWWLRNPRQSMYAGKAVSDSQQYQASEPAAPTFPALQLGGELLGSVGDTSKFVYLSDGGHFENMGLYELVRRRCRSIVICDAEEDHAYTFAGIGNAIERCRVDFGVEIDLNLLPLRPKLDRKLGYPVSKQHFVEGTIQYPDRLDDGRAIQGKILYIKASLTGQSPQFTGCTGLPFEPADLVNHRLEHAAFPNDTTANQWFDEQTFESYRSLGVHIADEIDKCAAWAKVLAG